MNSDNDVSQKSGSTHSMTEKSEALIDHARDLKDIASVVFLIGVVYIFYFAPMKLVRGDADRWDYLAGTAGGLFWVAAMWALSISF